jgi:hypothetical protein
MRKGVFGHSVPIEIRVLGLMVGPRLSKRLIVTHKEEFPTFCSSLNIF